MLERRNYRTGISQLEYRKYPKTIGVVKRYEQITRLYLKPALKKPSVDKLNALHRLSS